MTLAVLALFPGAAIAQTGCQTRPEITNHLKERWSETSVAGGFVQGGSVLEVFASVNGETWTMIMIQPNGCAVLLSTGEAWHVLPPKVNGNPL